MFYNDDDFFEPSYDSGFDCASCEDLELCRTHCGKGDGFVCPCDRIEEHYNPNLRPVKKI